jgi:hypothetical protein
VARCALSLHPLMQMQPCARGRRHTPSALWALKW